MESSPGRREFLGMMLGGAAGFSLPPRRDGVEPIRSRFTVFGQTTSGRHTPIAATPLTDNLIHFTGAGGNVVVVTAPDGLVMVNGGLQERSPDLLEAIAERTGGKRVQSLFNTDWHREHTGSNEALGKAGTKIIAHENTRQYLGSEIYVDWQKRSYQPLPPQALPGQTFYTSDKMTVGAERIEYGHLGQAHTDAAIYVFFPASNILVAGGALSVGRYPIADYTTGGWLGGLITANKTLLGLANAETRIVPGSGPIQTRADLQAQHDMLAAMLDRFVKMMKQGLGPEDIIAAAPTKELTNELEARWGNPDLFVSTAYRSMWLHVRELGGIV